MKKLSVPFSKNKHTVMANQLTHRSIRANSSDSNLAQNLLLQDS